MKTLTEYYKNGYDFTLVKREGDLAIAKGIRRGGNDTNWEVISIRGHNGMMMGDNWVEPKEFAPSNAEWGRLGWTAINEQDAERIFQERKPQSS